MRFLIVLIFAITLLSCSKDDNSIYDEKRNQLTGEWTVDAREVNMINDTIHSDIISSFQMTLNPDGTGSRINFGVNINFDWIYQNEPVEKISLHPIRDTLSGFLFLEESLLFTILVSSAENQAWESNNNPLFFINGETVVADANTKWQLSR